MGHQNLSSALAIPEQTDSIKSEHLTQNQQAVWKVEKHKRELTCACLAPFVWCRPGSRHQCLARGTPTTALWQSLGPSGCPQILPTGCSSSGSRQRRKCTSVSSYIRTGCPRPSSRTEPDHRTIVTCLTVFDRHTADNKNITSIQDMLCSCISSIFSFTTEYSLFSNFNDCMWFMYLYMYCL